MPCPVPRAGIRIYLYHIVPDYLLEASITSKSSTKLQLISSIVYLTCCYDWLVELSSGSSSKPCTMRSAFNESRAAITHDTLISLDPCEIISILILPSASTLWCLFVEHKYISVIALLYTTAGMTRVTTHVNIRPAIPTKFFICFPTMDRMAISCNTYTYE